ncbi:Disks large 1 tumor suppressor protein [Zootermopsis nevadensis]|uniref:Disks large 1 tumor suppressor protein n=1 Tax=Zootermopsis nevadensis TaxID=136037 RepID=A0A067RFK9_ZOONE|nr:Disks large 1 tumor suppressor protein [Zootermopsis nevadensis]
MLVCFVYCVIYEVNSSQVSRIASFKACFRLLKLNRPAEAHRALELLEDYHEKLTKPQDKQLRLAIERVIRIFKSRLFQALLGGSKATVPQQHGGPVRCHIQRAKRGNAFTMLVRPRAGR